MKVTEDYGILNKDRLEIYYHAPSHNEQLLYLNGNMSRVMIQPTKWVCAQISLGIRLVWSVFAVCMKKPWVLSYPLRAQRRLWSDWADAQADLSLRWVHTHFVRFFHVVAHIKQTKPITSLQMCRYLFKCVDIPLLPYNISEWPRDWQLDIFPFSKSAEGNFKANDIQQSNKWNQFHEKSSCNAHGCLIRILDSIIEVLWGNTCPLVPLK